jgi:DNA-binding beta-propeller fold protein YncE
MYSGRLLKRAAYRGNRLFWRIARPSCRLLVLSALGYAAFSGRAPADPPPGELVVDQATATGKLITPIAASGAIFQELDPGISAAPDRRATYGAAVAVAPNGKRLAIMTSGFPAWFDKDGKVVPAASMEYVFLFDVTGPAPRQLQVLSLPNTFPGLAWSPTSDRLFVSGGKDDDVAEFVGNGTKFAPGRTIKLGHKDCLGAMPSPVCGPVAAGIAIAPNGKRLLVANIQNDSVSLIDLDSGRPLAEQDLRAGVIDSKDHGKPGGSFPRAVAWTSNNFAYVASARDREVVALSVLNDKLRVVGRISVKGQPTALTANRTGSRLYVALDLTGAVAVFDTSRSAVIVTISAVSPTDVFGNPKKLGGANSNALALTPDERTLLVSNGDLNSIAVVHLDDRAAGRTPKHGVDDDKDHWDRSATVGLVPTGWYPTGVAVGKNGAAWYVVNGKSPMGPNSQWCQTTGRAYCDPKVVVQTAENIGAPDGINALLAKNVHVNQLEHAGFLAMPAPNQLELARLTKQVAHNNRYDRPDKTAADEKLFAFLHSHIKHVIYICKENRTYDQVLGDLEVGNGDPRLTLFPERNAPNHHAIARNFVTLDNLLVSGEGSMNGKDWTFAAQTSDMLERTDQLSLATAYKGETGGFPYGSDRSAFTAYATNKERHARDAAHTGDPDILPGAHSVYDLDGPAGEAGTGFIWNAALRGGFTVRNYGMFPNNTRVPPLRDLRAAGYKNPHIYNPSLMKYTDIYWPNGRGVPDFWRLREWKHEFDEFVAKESLPNLTVMLMGGDHFGWFDEAIDGVNTPETQMADNDYAIGQLIAALADSSYSRDTIVVTIEDDASDGPDHVDAQRTVALFAGPYVRQQSVISTRYTTVNVVKTIEEILGIGPIGLNDALAAPMSDVFDPNQKSWSYKAIVPNVLRSTQLPLPPKEHATIEYPTHSAKYWARAMAGQDFSGLDQINPVTFNRALWRGLKGKAAYPAVRVTDESH